MLVLEGAKVVPAHQVLHRVDAAEFGKDVHILCDGGCVVSHDNKEMVV